MRASSVMVLMAGKAFSRRRIWAENPRVQIADRFRPLSSLPGLTRQFVPLPSQIHRRFGMNPMVKTRDDDNSRGLLHLRLDECREPHSPRLERRPLAVEIENRE